jgi:tRNA threonylcarbamoyl adenosine modification protein YeaZ
MLRRGVATGGYGTLPRSMKILFLDLASNSQTPNQGACIACVSDKKTESIRFIDHRLGDDSLMPFLDEVMKEAGWTDRDLTHIACVTGPGGFTSLRMAVTLANAYSDQLQIPIAGIHLSDLYKERLAVSHERLVWLHSTKKTQLFARSFHGDLWKEPTLVSVVDLVAQLPDGASITGEILPEHREAVSVKHPVYPVPAAIPEILPAFLADLPYTQSALTPWYGRGW